MSVTYVIGHKNPDTDAICSAMAYADFLNRTGRVVAEGVCCGDLNARTRFALDRAKLGAPRLLLDVRPTAAKVARRDVVTAQQHETLADVYHRMQKSKLRAIPVMNDRGGLCGMVSILRLLELVLPDLSDPTGNRRIDSSLGRVAKVVGGTFLHAVEPHREEGLIQMVGAMSADGFTRRMREFPCEQLIIVAGDRPTVQLPAIEYGVRALVVTGGYMPSEGLLEMAKARGVSVLVSPWDTATTCLLIRGAKRIDAAVDQEVKTFPANAQIRQIRKVIQKESQTLFPVLDAEGRMIGVFSRSDLVDPEPVRLILVDHNELGQAVSGADEAHIVEVVDHHRVGGGLMTREPIRFINEPVGSTCTLIARFFHDAGVIPEPSISLCMMAGMISDTLNLTSPTTTAVDRLLLSWLADVGGHDVGSFASDFFAAGSVLELSSPQQAVSMDCKDYEEAPWRFMVAQIEENGLDRFWDHRDELGRALEDKVRSGPYDFGCLLITDITTNNSLLLVAGAAEFIQAIDYPRRDDTLFELDQVVSRKKQLLPHISQLLSGLVKEVESSDRS
ncbi:MAG TPA: putative manganese-dependent inorganic diphosphatase [Kiritimatiellia bacterium]|nr:putative manganese-dependent inorganic diphosphatase [Kiritimatiellia bacterium]